MFQNRWRSTGPERRPPETMQWWGRSVRERDPAERLAELRRQLGSAMVDAGSGKYPLFLSALGLDLDRELEELIQGTAFGAGTAAPDFARRRDVLEEMVNYYSEAVLRSSRVFDAIDLSDCAREAVAGLSGDMILVLRIQSRPHAMAGRGQVISLFEVAIQSASARPNDEVEVTLRIRAEGDAEFAVSWPRTSSSEEGLQRHRREKERFFALTIACALKVGATLRRQTGAWESLVVRIPSPNASSAPTIDRDVVERAIAICIAHS